MESFQAAMPQEIIVPVYEELLKAGLPQIATRDVDPGIFFRIKQNKKFSDTHNRKGLLIVL